MRSVVLRITVLSYVTPTIFVCCYVASEEPTASIFMRDIAAIICFIYVFMMVYLHLYDNYSVQHDNLGANASVVLTLYLKL
jgi:hypothetical protein